ncbi:MAG: hypothetical protein E7517_02570 [Ruminococcaceae bacterium]|nr:hypothetical protein [Oscillospiraceae bacterium]
MKEKQKKKYQYLKPDGQAYAELVSEYERDEMPDYSFKSSAQAMGKNAKKLKRIKIVRIVLSVIGAILVLYLGYFIIALIKGVNSRTQVTTTAYVEMTQDERTTVPETTAPEDVSRQQTTRGETSSTAREDTATTTAPAEQGNGATEESGL